MAILLEDARDLLKEWREVNARHSDEVVKLWDYGLKEEINSLGDEKWMVLEQVAVAAMDIYRGDVVDDCLRMLNEHFGAKSLRVKRLHAMSYEMREKWVDANDILDEILREDEANSSARKRKIAIAKARGDNAQAIQELTKYLKIFMSDQEAWQELCDLYIQEQDYAKACFCIEEVLLHNPHNHLYHQRLADIRYTMGGFEQLEIAKQYYSQAVKLAPSNMRALYGLLLTASQLAASSRCSQTKRDEYRKTALWTKKQITSRYKAACAVDMRGLEGLLSSLDLKAPSS